MTLNSVDILVSHYSFFEREKNGLTKKAKKFLKKSFSKNHILLIGYGGTISSGYTPTHETIVPLSQSPAKKSISYMKLFGTLQLEVDHIPLLDKDSRDVADEDISTLLDILMLCPNERILITVGTYLGPKITEILFHIKSQFKGKKIVTTGSILPAGFVASDAEANIWGAISVLNYVTKTKPKSEFVAMVFHGNTYSNHKELNTLNLHPDSIKNMVIQYPLSTIPVDGVI